MFTLESLTVRIIPDTDPDPSYLEQEGFEDRLAEYNADGFAFVCVRAVAEIRNTDTGLSRTIRTGGLWGIESDSGADYLVEVGREELAQLRDELDGLGIDLADFDKLAESVRVREYV